MGSISNESLFEIYKMKDKIQDCTKMMLEDIYLKGLHLSIHKLYNTQVPIFILDMNTGIITSKYSPEVEKQLSNIKILINSHIELNYKHLYLQQIY